MFHFDITSNAVSVMVISCFQCCSHVYNLMLLKCRALYALKFALVSKIEAIHHLALENMKTLKVGVSYLCIVLKNIILTVTEGKFFLHFFIFWLLLFQ